MMANWTLLRWIACRLGWCGGDVVSGWHENVLWIGWRCRRCGAVRHYYPTEIRLTETQMKLSAPLEAASPQTSDAADLEAE